MRDIKVATFTKLYVLMLLKNGPKYGYELMNKTLDALGKKPSSGEIYPFLKQLKKQKLIRIKKKGARDKKVYLLTKDGVGFINKIMDNLQEVIEVLIKDDVKSCAHCDCMVYKRAHTEKIKGKKLSFCCKHCAKAYIRGG